jgi:hypothetical protein
MAPNYEDDISRLPQISSWQQIFPTTDGIFARHDSPRSLVEYRSTVSIHHSDDPKNVLIAEKHDNWYRRIIAEKVVVLPMIDALSSGRLPYRFILPNGDPSTELAAALQLDELKTEELRWGPQLIQLESERVRRIRSVIDGDKVFVIVEEGNLQTVVYGGTRAELSAFGLLRHAEALEKLT